MGLVLIVQRKSCRRGWWLHHFGQSGWKRILGLLKKNKWRWIYLREHNFQLHSGLRWINLLKKKNYCYDLEGCYIDRRPYHVFFLKVIALSRLQPVFSLYFYFLFCFLLLFSEDFSSSFIHDLIINEKTYIKHYINNYKTALYLCKAPFFFSLNLRVEVFELFTSSWVWNYRKAMLATTFVESTITKHTTCIM